MTENQMDGGQPDGTATNANSGASSQGGVQQPSFDAVKLQETFDAFGKQLETLTSRVNGLQSVKDKDKQELTGLKQRIAEYEQLKEKFGSDGAIEQIELKQTLSDMKEQLLKLTGSTSTPTPGTGTSGAGELAQVIADNQLDANDPAVVKILADFKGLRAATELGKLAASRASKTASPGASTSIPGGGTVPQQDVSTLTAEYQTKMRAAPRGPAGDAIRDALKLEYKGKGVDIWNIDFS